MKINTELPTLVLVCKRPALHHGKQRIAATLGADTALAIAERLLDCALEDLRAWPGPVVIAPDTPAAAGWASTLLTRPIDILPQGEGNLGERLNTLDSQLRRRGVQQTLFIGSDAPILDEALYHDAIAALAHADIVLSPADDGGVTLMANGRPWPTLTALPWSTEQLGDALADACRREGQSICLLKTSYDIDNEADLAKLHQDILDDARPARQRLRGLIATLIEKTTQYA